MSNIEISERAADELRSHPSDTQTRIREKFLEEVAERPDHYLLKLSGREEFRVRIGEYRAIVDQQRTEST